MVRRSVSVALIVLVLVAMAFATAPVASAKDITITLQPGESARVPLRFWCLDFGQPFPTDLAEPGPRAPEGVVKVLLAAQALNLFEPNPYQSQIAIWYASDGQFHDPAGEGHAVADEIITRSLTIDLPPLPTGVVTAALAIEQGLITTTLESFQVVTDTAHPNVRPYTGKGDLLITNATSDSIEVLLLEGTVFGPMQPLRGQRLVAHIDMPENPPPSGGPGLMLQYQLWGGMVVGLLAVVAGLWLRRSRVVEEGRNSR